MAKLLGPEAHWGLANHLLPSTHGCDLCCGQGTESSFWLGVGWRVCGEPASTLGKRIGKLRQRGKKHSEQDSVHPLLFHTHTHTHCPFLSYSRSCCGTTVSGIPLFSSSTLVRHSAGYIPLGISLNVLADHNLCFVIPVLQMKKLIPREGEWVGSREQAGECQS